MPDGEPGTSKHPFATGFGAGVTVGVIVVPDWMSLILDYRYGHTSTRKGEVAGVLLEAQGVLDFHLISAGVRIENRLGPGSVYGQLIAGILLPFHTTVELEYAPELAAIGITGEGTQEADFGVGFGAQGELGYHIDLPARLYVGAGLRVSTFQSNNAGKETTFENFVMDFTATPPVAVTTEIHHGTEAPVTPTTYAISDVRLAISLGYRF